MSVAHTRSRRLSTDHGCTGISFLAFRRLKIYTHLCLRFIPSPAGNSVARELYVPGMSVHPHACGEQAKATFPAPIRIGNHTFRATGITAYLKNNGTLETAQHIANHASPRTTMIYDRRQEEISLDEVERIAI